ncbi:terminase small subunit [Hyphomicrobium sp. CS1BSMeth3]|uniref:terminase small subunit n=1 Tax=Hyphomicrobium sp. CS1BSMeth3 TaxID=1892844 RepID=UPI000930D25D|nr:terminase small subunit [Hyphomicrobium sp. CS1BSMeth3]
MALTGKRARFVQEFLKDLNGTQAAIRAGYSERTATVQAYELLRHPDVAAAIDAAKIERSREVGVDAAWVLRRLAAEAEADIADLYNSEGGLKPIHEWPLIWRQGLVAGVDVEELFEGRGDDREHVGTLRKIKLSDRTRRLELIGKHISVNAFQDVIQHKGLDGLRDRLARANGRLTTPRIDVPGRDRRKSKS